MIAGVVMNLATALILLTLLAFFGLPTLINKDGQGEDQFTVASDERVVTQQVLINYVESNSPASTAGLKTMDRVESIGPVGGQQQKVNNLTELQQKTKELAGQKIQVVYEREGEDQRADVQLR